MLFLFQTFGLCRILYFGCYRCWAFRPFVTVLTFILYEDYYYLSCIIILFPLLSIYYILKVAGVTKTLLRFVETLSLEDTFCYEQRKRYRY